jgi:hypothetical protein
MLYLLTAVGLTPFGSSTVHIYTQTIHRPTHLTQTIHRTTHLTNWEECGPWGCALSLRDRKEYDKRKSHISRKLYVIYISSNNIRHPVTKTFTTLYYTSPNYTSLHFTTFFDTALPFKLHPTTLH